MPIYEAGDLPLNYLGREGAGYETQRAQGFPQGLLAVSKSLQNTGAVIPVADRSLLQLISERPKQGALSVRRFTNDITRYGINVGKLLSLRQ